MTDIEAILQAKIAEENQMASQAGQIAMVPGALIGGTLGYDVGNTMHSADQVRTQLGDRVRAMVGDKPREPGMLNRITPGNRMAGTLVGAIIGGGLGKVAMEQALQTDAGRLLAKAQMQGDLNDVDKQQLQNMVTEYYNSQGLF